MAVIQLKIRSDFDNYRYRVDLDNTTYVFSFKWNTRSERWQITIYASDGETVLISVPLTANADLLTRFRDKNLPKGRLFCIDTTGQWLEPTNESLGETHLLIYEEAGT